MNQGKLLWSNVFTRSSHPDVTMVYDRTTGEILGHLMRGRWSERQERWVNLKTWYVVGHEYQSFRSWGDALDALRDHTLYDTIKIDTTCQLSINDGPFEALRGKQTHEICRTLKKEVRRMRRKFYHQLKICQERGAL